MVKENYNDDPIIDYFDKELERREQRLHAAYQNRDLFEFTHGAEWFIEHVNAIHHEYGWPRVSGSIFDKETLDHMNSPKWHRICWEVDNGYLRDE